MFRICHKTIGWLVSYLLGQLSHLDLKVFQCWLSAFMIWHCYPHKLSQSILQLHRPLENVGPLLDWPIRRSILVLVELVTRVCPPLSLLIIGTLLKAWKSSLSIPLSLLIPHKMNFLSVFFGGNTLACFMSLTTNGTTCNLQNPRMCMLTNGQFSWQLTECFR